MTKLFMRIVDNLIANDYYVDMALRLAYTSFGGEEQMGCCNAYAKR